MPFWRQLVVVFVLAAGATLVWARYVPSAGPLLARLGLPVREAAAPEPEDGPGGAPGGGFGGGRGGQAALVNGGPVGEGRANARVSAIGDGRSLRSVAVTPLDSGRLVVLEVVSGATVEPGDVIARLDSDIEAIALERAELVVADAETTYTRVEALLGRGAATDVQERVARLALDRARLEARDAALALERRTIEAPIGGVVGLLEVEEGLQVDVDTVIAAIEDRSSLLVEFRVPERVVGAIGVGDTVTAAPLARPDLTLEGRIVALDNRIELDSRTLRVQAALPNDGDQLRAGMAFAIEMRLPGDPYPEVDSLAIQWDAEGAFVWVERDGRAARRPVRIVQRNAERVLVAGAFGADERVVAEGVQRLREGMELRFVGDPPPEPDDGADDGAGLGLTRADGVVSGG